MSTLAERAFHCRTLPTDRNGFARAVEAGLSAGRKSLPRHCLFDGEGWKLFGAVAGRPEHYPRRCEAEILKVHADDIASAAGPGVRIVELNVGDGSKSRPLLESVLRRNRRLSYLPVDLSEAVVRSAATGLLHALKGLEIEAHVGEDGDALDRLFADEPAPTMVVLLGSGLGHLHRAEALSFLSRLRRRFRPFDQLLVGIDLRKDDAVATAAYNDAAGRAAAFNRNALGRINRELGGAFELEAFDHVASFSAEDGRVELHLRSVRPQVVRVEAFDRYFDFEDGETVWTHSSYTYQPGQVAEMCALTGWMPVHRWLDAKSYYAVELLAPAPGRPIT